MRERIILAPGARGSELISSLALHGVNCINLKIMGAAQLARYILMRSGVPIEQEFLNSREECTIITKAIAGEEYYGRPTYADIRHITQSMKKMRMLVTGEEERVVGETLARGIFTEKNEALLQTYRNYMKIMAEANAIDTVSLIRKAIAEGKKLEADLECLCEYPLSPLERTLLEKAAGGEGAYRMIKLSDLYKKGSIENANAGNSSTETAGEGNSNIENTDGENSNTSVKIDSFRNCYGSPNEVETILSDIYGGRILSDGCVGRALDSCTVAVTDAATYSQLFFDYALLYDIPMTFGCGVPIINANPARLLVLYYHWITDGFFGVDALNEMIDSKTFNKSVWREQFPEPQEGFSWKFFYEVLGGLRLTNNAETNRERIENYKAAIAEEERISEEEKISGKDAAKDYRLLTQKKQCIPFLEIAARELALETEDFIQKYAYIRRGSKNNSDVMITKIDLAAVKAIYEELGVIRRAGTWQSKDDLIKNVLGIGICGERSEAGKLHITDIGGALTVMRENIYIAGLSATKFPGSPTEDYLLLDADIKLFGAEAEYMTSEGKIKGKRERLMSLAKLASELHSHIFVSYPGLNVSELKKDNASSMLFELCRAEAGSSITVQELEARVEKIDYFTPAISATREIGRAYNAGGKIRRERAKEPEKISISVSLDREWSPSAISLFIKDRPEFLLKYMLGLSKTDPTDPFTVISPIAAGNIAHRLMEKLANSGMGKDEFLRMSEEYFDRYLKENPPLVTVNVSPARDDFMELMENAFDGDKGREVVMAEEEIHCTHPSGVKLYGYPDRVEKLEDGSFLIVDYKTGRKMDHIEDDIMTCVQVVIYAYMLEQQGYNVSGGEFRYVRLGEVIPCRYDDEMKAALTTVLEQFKEDIENFSFGFGETEDEE